MDRASEQLSTTPISTTPGINKLRVLVVEDEEDILELVRYNLEREGLEVIGVGSGEDGLRAAQNLLPEAVILDIMLPGKGGLDVCRELKSFESTKDIPIIMLSARGEESDIVLGLELGADDYITKPFSPRILNARVRAVLRRKNVDPIDDNSVVNAHNISIHPGRHEVKISGEPVSLTVSEFRILHFLARHPGWVFTRYQIVDAVKGDDYPVTDRSIDVQMVGLRKKLAAAGKYIETVRGVGYRFRE